MIKKSVVFPLRMLLLLWAVSCSDSDTPLFESPITEPEVGEQGEAPREVPMGDNDYFYLALGDSYTIGTGIDPKDSYPSQLTLTLNNRANVSVNLEVIATNGWRTDDLIRAIEGKKRQEYSFVTLLIGVNNQFQGIQFSVFQDEFKTLLDRSIALAENRPGQVIVISIPDYTYSPGGKIYDFGGTTSDQIDDYNTFARNTAIERGSRFIDITDISREGLKQPDLIAPDSLHLSGKAYKQVMERLLPAFDSIFPN